MKFHSKNDLMENEYDFENDSDFVNYSGGPKKNEDSNELYCENCNKYYSKNKWKTITEKYTEAHNNLCPPFSLNNTLREDSKVDIVFYSVYLQCPKCGKKYLTKKYSKFVHK